MDQERLVTIALLVFTGSPPDIPVGSVLSAGLADSQAIAAILSANARLTFFHLPLEAWVDPECAKQRGDAYLLAQQQIFQKVNSNDAWSILAVSILYTILSSANPGKNLQSRHPCLSEAVTAVLTKTHFEFNFITEPLNTVLSIEPFNEKVNSYKALESNYNSWRLQPYPVLPFPIDTSFFYRIRFRTTKDIFARVAILFREAPMEFLVKKWQGLRNTSRYACACGYTPLLRQILQDNSSPYILSALVDGMAQAKTQVPAEHSSFLHLRKWLKRDMESMALHDHDPNDRLTTITLTGMSDSMESGE
ncbi:hypothetical protein BJY01DRAFT_256209 [Aspergillus pseudoustus]|uniref:Uncharacterized protein n=1 Tax=Aspergillus pseudoustus TaxID=1810923 RepID=A0ABR4IFL5_9EURO